MKRDFLVFVSLLILLSVVCSVAAQGSSSDIVSGVKSGVSDVVSSSSGIASDVGSGLSVLQKYGNFGGQSINISADWKAVGDNIQEKLLANPWVKLVDSFFHQINIVFIILFAQNYSLSFFLLLSVVIWSIIVAVVYNAMKSFSTFSKFASFAIAFVFTIIVAQLRAINGLVNLIMLVAFGANKPWWLKLLIACGIVIVVFAIAMVLHKLGKKIDKKRQERKDYENRLKLETGGRAGEALSEAMSEGGKGK